MQEGAPAVLGKLLKDQAGYAFDPSEVFRFAALALSVVCTATLPEDIKKAVVKAGGVDGLVAGIHPDHPEVTRTVLTALEMLVRCVCTSPRRSAASTRSLIISVRVGP